MDVGREGVVVEVVVGVWGAVALVGLEVAGEGHGRGVGDWAVRRWRSRREDERRVHLKLS